MSATDVRLTGATQSPRPFCKLDGEPDMVLTVIASAITSALSPFL